MSGATRAPVARRYRNPVYDAYFADPYVLRLEDRYFAYGTGSVVGGRIFEILESRDLASWRSVGGALEPIAPELGTDCWAPEVVQAEGRFFLYYSVGFDQTRHQLRVAVAESPYGPFVDCGVNLASGERFAIDPNPFQDADGTWYLYYARDVLEGERVGTQLAVDRMPSMTSLSGQPQTVLAASAEWQLFQRDRPMYGRRYDWYTLEGPAVLRHSDRYYCLYSGGSWENESYSVSWASSPSPLGPWTEPSHADGRLLATVPGRVQGPGHNSVLRTPGGSDLIVYHAWDPSGSKRQMYLDLLCWDGERPYTAGPTWEAQPLPE